MQIQTLIQTFETYANPLWQEKWDNCGWQVQPDILDQPAHVLVCLTPTLAVVQEALDLRAQGHPVNLIFAHHPLIFFPLKNLRHGDPLSDTLRLCLTHNLGIYTAHTNFDQVPDGTADTLAQRLNLQDCQPLETTHRSPSPGGSSNNCDRGYGRIGGLTPAPSLAQLLDRIQAALHPPHLIYSPSADLTQPIHRLAVLGGSGAGYLKAAAEAGAQAYLTADCKFHQFQEARDRQLILIDAGHYATERPACAKLVDRFRTQGVPWAALSQQDEDFRHFWANPSKTAFVSP